jgi:hypothetical protein
VGVALGTTVPSLLTLFFVTPRIYRRELGIGLGTIAQDVWLRSSVAVLPFAVATWYVERHWAAHQLLEFFAQVAVILPLAIVGSWFFAVDEEDRAAVRARLQRLRRSVA